MKRILIINGFLELGGAERVLVHLANHLSESYVVNFAILQESENRLFQMSKQVNLIQLNLEKNRLSVKEMGLSGAAKYYINTVKKIREVANELNVDLVIAFNDREVFLSWLAFHNDSKIKLLFSQRSSPYSKPWRTNLFLKYIYKHCDAVAFQLEQVRKYYDINKSLTCQIIENPVKLPDRFEYYHNREKVIIAAGRLTKVKRFDLLINAFSIFHAEFPEYRLIIYGDGVERESLQALIDNLDLGNDIQLHESIPNVMSENRLAEMFVLSSDYEGIPNVLIEAMALGIPSISTDCTPGGGDLITNHGQCGILIPKNNVEELCNAMKKYCLDKSLQEENVRKAYEYLKIFDEKQIYKKWDDLINACLIGSNSN